MVQVETSHMGMEVQVKIRKAESVFKGNPKNSLSSIAWCFCYNIIVLGPNKDKFVFVWLSVVWGALFC